MINNKTILTTVQIVAITLTGLVAGLFFIFSYDINIAFQRLDPAEYGYTMKIINESIRNPWFFAAFFGSMAVSALTILLMVRHYRSPAFMLFLTGFVVYAISVFGVTTTINLPLNYYLESWDLAAVPADWIDVRDRWNQATLWRTWGAIVTFVIYLIGLVKSAELFPANSSTPLA